MISLRCEEIDIDALDNTGEFLQSSVWAKHKEAFGWTARAFRFFNTTFDTRDTTVETTRTTFHDRHDTDTTDTTLSRHSTPGTPYSFSVLVLTRRLVAGLSISYIPHGPSLKIISEIRRDLGDRVMQDASGAAGVHLYSGADILSAIAGSLKPFLKSSLFLRYDLNWPLTSAFSGSLAGRSLTGSPAFVHDPDSGRKILAGGISWEDCGLNGGSAAGQSPGALLKSAADIQPPDTVIVDIDPERHSEEDLLKAMKSKTRYNVRLADKKGVEIREINRADYQVPDELGSWYELYRITEERNRIALHSREYYAQLFRLTDARQCRLYMASHDGDLLAGIIVTAWDRQGRYLYGASSNVKRNLMPSYGLQWRAIRDLRAEGCSTYDFFGIPPYADKDHPMFGLYQFKTGFGGTIVHTPGAWDRPLKPFLYRLYRLAEALRMYYYRVFLKRGN